MESLEIVGGTPLEGVLHISGAKNGALPTMAAALLTREKVRLRNVPRTKDILMMVEVLRNLGVTVRWCATHTLDMQVMDETSCWVPEQCSKEMRASICVLGPVMARRGVAHFAPPGGCKIGDRPIEAHLNGLRALGARVVQTTNAITASTRKLTGAMIDLRVPSGSTVLGTINVMSAATLAKGRTVIQSAAKEPEVNETARLLNLMGARISGIGTGCLVIDGVDVLHGAEFRIIPDRIEAGTYMAAAAITAGNVLLRGVCREDMEAVFAALDRMGVSLVQEGHDWRVRSNGRFKPTAIVTECFPGFPTDMQAQIMTMMCLADGVSTVKESIYPQRFGHIAELRRMGARIKFNEATAKIVGVKHLTGATVLASDLRASAALVLAGLVARGTTIIKGLEHLDRGYERIEEKLSALGGKIRRVRT